LSLLLGSHLNPQPVLHFSTAGLPAVVPLLGQLAASITRSLEAAVTAAQQQQQAIAAALAAPPGPQHQQKQVPKGLTAEQAAESTAAAGLLTLLVQLSEQAAAAAAAGGQPAELQLPAELQPAAKAAAAVAAADFGGGVVRLPSQGVALVEACLEVCWVGVDGGFSSSVSGWRAMGHWSLVWCALSQMRFEWVGAPWCGAVLQARGCF